ncbi:MAG TPA: 7-cyano-7-deazaguanine synthase, partial [Ignavibacteriaceae bacterium]|nr:7-cyano-7-deazaguanine synthase [Ignavibacteriaceae bacterium]
QITNIPSPEWIPFRNQHILTIGAMYSIRQGYNNIIIGSVKTDRQYKDGRKTFYKILNKLFSFQEGNIFVSHPGIKLSTKQLIQHASLSLDVLGWCHSCTNSYLACGRCPSCIKHQEVMLSLGYNSF